jgi:hypothetical protein
VGINLGELLIKNKFLARVKGLFFYIDSISYLQSTTFSSLSRGDEALGLWIILEIIQSIL